MNTVPGTTKASRMTLPTSTSGRWLQPRRSRRGACTRLRSAMRQRPARCRHALAFMPNVSIVANERVHVSPVLWAIAIEIQQELELATTTLILISSA